MPAIDWGYTPGAANSLAANYDASVQNRNLLAQQARTNEIGNYQLNSLKRADAERIALADAYKSALDPATGSVDETRLYQGLAQGGMGHLLPDVQSKFLGLRKDRSAIEETDTKTAAAKVKLANDRHQWTWNALGNSPTPEVAIANIQKGVQDGSLSFAEANAEIQKLNGIAPQDFAKYRLQSIQRTLSGMDAANAQLPKVARVDIGGGIMGVNDNPFSPDYNQPTGQMFKKTPTFSERTAAGNLALSQSQEQWKRDHPGYDIQATETGLVGVNKDNPRDVVPIALDGKPVGAKPPPAEMVKVDRQLSNLAGSLKSFKDEVGKKKLTGAKGLFTGEDTANMKSKYTALLMGVKDLYELGALTGPDMGIVEDQIENPASWAASFTSQKAAQAQIQVLEDMLRRNHINAETSYGRPLKATAAAIKLFGESAAGGAADNDPMGLRK